ncbi:MAG: DUF4388 domain-containing protein [Desulfobacteraceae bacterium]
MFEGKLKTFSISSLLQMCYNESNTGALEFSKNGHFCGKIGFENGAVVYADFVGMKGEQAVKQLSILEDIDFKFNGDEKILERNIETDINYLIIDCSRYKDECIEHLDTIKEKFSEKYPVRSLGFFEYDSIFFSFPETYHINYLEISDEEGFSVIYTDKDLNVRIKAAFHDNLFTDDLTMFMKKKDMLK